MPGPVLALAILQTALETLRQRGVGVVLTNGVFDVLHVGHLRSLRLAKREGDVLVVGVNADGAVHKPGRPLVPDSERAELVAALDPVDYVVIFPEPTADALLRAIRPAVYAKGADYQHKPLPEAATAEAVGARIVFIPLVPNRSTTSLVERLSRMETLAPP